MLMKKRKPAQASQTHPHPHHPADQGIERRGLAVAGGTGWLPLLFFVYRSAGELLAL